MKESTGHHELHAYGQSAAFCFTLISGGLDRRVEDEPGTGPSLGTEGDTLGGAQRAAPPQRGADLFEPVWETAPAGYLQSVLQEKAIRLTIVSAAHACSACLQFCFGELLENRPGDDARVTRKMDNVHLMAMANTLTPDYDVSWVSD